MIVQERTIQQLKKLWANLKQSQREALTKEKQSQMAIGGGPPISEAIIDPDVALITPHLMKTTPVLFSSNMSENEFNENEEHVVRNFQVGNVSMIYKNDEELTKNTEVIFEINESDASEDTSNKENENIEGCTQTLSVKRKEKWDNTRAPQKMKGKRTIKHTFGSEDDIKMERIKRIMEQEKEVADMRKVHEERVIQMKEKFLTELHTLEIRAVQAKVELAELQLKKEKETMKVLI